MCPKIEHTGLITFSTQVRLLSSAHDRSVEFRLCLGSKNRLTVNNPSTTKPFFVVRCGKPWDNAVAIGAPVGDHHSGFWRCWRIASAQQLHVDGTQGEEAGR